MKHNQTLIRWYKKIKSIKYLGNKCEHCNTTDVRHLTFHHIDPNYKEDTISQIFGKRWEYIQNELDKCILLCKNCHMKHHYNISNSDKRICKLIMLDYKNNECKKCGYNDCPASLTFHHIDKKNKSFTISENISERFISIVDMDILLKNELDKCEILCSNCHNAEHLRDDILEYVIENYDNIKIEYKSKKVDRLLVKDMYFNKNMKQVDIAKHFNVSKSTISMIIKDIENNTL